MTLSLYLILSQVQNIIADSKSQDLLEGLKRDCAISSLTNQEQINSRRNAEKILGPDENLFRIDWVCAVLSSCTDL